MRKFALISAAICVLFASAAQVQAMGFYASTNELGYRGEVWNITDGTGAWDIVPDDQTRNANLYLTSGYGSEDYNIVLSSWWEHRPSNQNPGFLQLYDTGNVTATSITAGWNDDRTEFSVQVTGEDAPYPYSRFWQPDEGHAWGVTFTEYEYEFTATFSTPATAGAGGFYNTVAPDTITGSFTGEFVSTYDLQKNPITDGDTYGFSVLFDKQWFDADGGDYGQITPASDFGTVPEPLTMITLTGAIGALGGYIRRRRMA